MATAIRLELRGPTPRAFDTVLTPEALEFVGALQHEFGARRAELLDARARRRARLAAGEMLDFLPETREVRDGDWQVAPVPPDLQQRWVEITGPTERKMVINALNSGRGRVHGRLRGRQRAELANMVEGHINLRDAIDGHDHLRRLRRAPLRARPRTRPRCSSAPAAGTCPSATCSSTASPCPARCSTSACTSSTARRGCCAAAAGPTSTCPRWSPTSRRGCGTTCSASPRTRLGIARGTIKATVLIETLPAAFEMDEILYELREHSAGLNAGRWDYIFSAIKCFPERPEMVLPDRGDVTMTVPFMRAYTELLAATCHRRGAHAMGGMAALIPSRKDEEANAKALDGGSGRQGARGRAGLRRHLGRPSRSRARGPGGVRAGPERRAQPARSASATTSTSPPTSCSTWPRRRARSPKPGCAPTSTSASSTSPSGSAAAGRRRSTR